MDLSKLTIEQLIELYKHGSNQNDGTEYFIKLLHDKEGDTK